MVFESLGTVSYSYLHSTVTTAHTIYNFRGEVRHWSKITIFSTPPAFDPSRARFCQNIAITFGVVKLKLCGYLMMEKV